MYIDKIFTIFLMCILTSYIYLMCILYLYPEYIYVNENNINICHPFTVTIIISFFIYNQFDERFL
jgi:hypothetical protein